MIHLKRWHTEIIRIRPGTKTERGSTVPDWTNASRLTIPHCLVQPASTELSQDGRILGVTDGLFPLTSRYLTVVLGCAPVFVLYHILSASVRTDSDPKLSAAASGVVITANILLDLLFMLGFRWGIIGASASLCIAETLGVLTLLLHFRNKRALLRLRPALPRLSDLTSFAANGFGMGSAYVFQALVMLVFNKLLIRFVQEIICVQIMIGHAGHIISAPSAVELSVIL